MTPFNSTNNAVINEAAAAMQAAYDSGDKEKITQSWSDFGAALADTIKSDAEQCANDRQALMSRGYRMLTSAEQSFYNSIIEASKQSNPQQAFTSLIDSDAMPETIFEDVYRNLVDEHPLLDAISFTSVKYLTKWLINDHTKSSAAWGAVNEKITKEIESSFEIIELAQAKVSCFLVLPLDMLDLGPTFLDAYIRKILSESLAVALENAIVDGDGKNKPIGFNRDIHKGVSVSDGVYPKKTAIKVADFTPATYGELVSKLVKTEKGRYRKVDKVALICNPIDYFKKIMPATTAANADGSYTRNVFPVPTDTYQSAEIEESKAIMCIPKEYFMAMASDKKGAISYSDEFKFLDDARTWKLKAYANGRPYDNTVSILLDISELSPFYVTVLNKSTVPTV